ncbi:uncharacterized protein LOC142546752 [Primulina tabacum]|uniref:uncharacterized protein LOC142546752 n=1 Tax=Primulina tabacum TaxID=48773 RepID=UPI003F5937B3
MLASIPPPPAIATSAAVRNDLFAAVDIGTNSFKLTIVRAEPSSGLFLSHDHLKEPVVLGLDTTSTSAPATISAASIERSLSALHRFQKFLNSYQLPPSNLRLVATSAVREASNKSQFISSVRGTLNLDVEIISGIQEARLIYLGILQFFPVFTSTVLIIDIGGGSTEFAVGLQGNILFSKSLRLGHVTLTQEFTDIIAMRKHIQTEVQSCGLIEKIKNFKIDMVIGASGTIKAIEKAVFKGYTRTVGENVGLIEDFVKREWKFNKEELKSLVESLCEEEKEMEGKVKRIGFFKDREAFISAGAILLDEIFEMVGIDEMEVSGYALGEGVITEMLGQVLHGFDLNANARWRSVAKLSSRFNNKKRIQAANVCACISREIFEGLRKLNEPLDSNFSVALDDKDLEFLESASLLHNIGLHAGKKGYHKQSYRIIVNGDQLHGYSEEEIKKIGLLVRYHRKKFPKSDVLEGSSKEAKKKFVILCTILRVSAAVQQSLQCLSNRIMKFKCEPEGFKLVVGENEERNQSFETVSPLEGGANALMDKELEHFRMVFKKNLSVVVASSIS